MTPISVLFLCTGNSARSVIAETLLKSIGGADFEVHSAGTRPKGLNPYTAKVLDEAGLDYTGFRSKNVDEFIGDHFDYVITVCDSAAEECPVFPGNPNLLHWSFPDPAAVDGDDLTKLAAFQQALREMRQRLEAWVPVVLRDSAAAR